MQLLFDFWKKKTKKTPKRCFLSEFKCGCLLAPFKFHQQPSHEVGQCNQLEAVDIFPVT